MRTWATMVLACMSAGVLIGAAATVAVGQGKGNAATGKTVYENEDCASCHGAAGKGDGPEGQKLKDRPTNWTAADGGGLKGMTDQQMFDIIAKGGRAVGKSRGMPAAKLNDGQIWDLVAYVKTLAKK